jgi:hypothetical protein
MIKVQVDGVSKLILLCAGVGVVIHLLWTITISGGFGITGGIALHRGGGIDSLSVDEDAYVGLFRLFLGLGNLSIAFDAEACYAASTGETIIYIPRGPRGILCDPSLYCSIILTQK